MTTTLDDAPLLPLDEFRRIAGLSPWAFWQQEDARCKVPTLEHAWQNSNAVSRQEIVRALLSAERQLKNVLGYAIAPQLEQVEEHPFPEHYDPRLSHLESIDAKGRWMPHRTRYGYVQSFGLPVLTKIGDANITKVDADGDQIDDTFTLTIAAPVGMTDAGEVVVYFADAERWDGSGVSERWQIRPVKATISAGTITVRGRLWSIIKPVHGEGKTPQTKSPADAATYPTQLAVYRCTRDPATHGSLIWETIPDGCACNTALLTTDPAGVASQVARFTVRASRQGWIAGEAAGYDTTAQAWVASGWAVAHAPTRVSVNYVAGHPLERGDIPEWLKVIVVKLACCELTREMCDCDTGNVLHWREDLAKQKTDGGYSLPFETFQNPFGTRRGQVEAWREIAARDMILTRGALN